MNSPALPDRLVITYDYHGVDPAKIADLIRVEQTIEFPLELASPWIADAVVGKIEEITTIDLMNHRIIISYNPDVVGGELTALLNVLWGNASLFPGLRVVGLAIPESITSLFKGPRFGVTGLRELFGAKDRPLLCTALKPMGSDSKTLAAMASTIALAGFDMIKDDHSLANQPWSRWRERVRAVSDAVSSANEKTGGNCLYAPSLNLPADQIFDAAHSAKALGAGALLVLPGITGFDSMRALAADDELALPIQGHPAFLGSLVASKDGGISHGVLFGTLMRLAGADISIFPNFGGRFSFTQEQCREIQVAAAAPLHGLHPIWLAPAGGMSIEGIPEMLEFYGRDLALLIGGALHRGDLSANAVRMSALVRAL